MSFVVLVTVKWPTYNRLYIIIKQINAENVTTVNVWKMYFNWSFNPHMKKLETPHINTANKRCLNERISVVDVKDNDETSIGCLNSNIEFVLFWESQISRVALALSFEKYR